MFLHKQHSQFITKITFQMLAKYTTGPAPLSLWLKAFPLRLIVGPLAAGLVAITPTLLAGSAPSYTYLFILMCLYVFHQVSFLFNKACFRNLLASCVHKVNFIIEL